jgi:uncharacterized membrane protein
LARVGAVDRVRSWGRQVRENPWLAVGIVAAVLLICAWIAWAINVTNEQGARQGLGVLIVWPAVVAVLALISIPFVWAFRVIRTSARSGEQGPREAEKRDSADSEATEPG